jgi:hypothetical protein
VILHAPSWPGHPRHSHGRIPSQARPRRSSCTGPTPSTASASAPRPGTPPGPPPSRSPPTASSASWCERAARRAHLPRAAPQIEGRREAVAHGVASLSGVDDSPGRPRESPRPEGRGAGRRSRIGTRPPAGGLAGGRRRFQTVSPRGDSAGSRHQRWPLACSWRLWRGQSEGRARATVHQQVRWITFVLFAGSGPRRR